MDQEKLLVNFGLMNNLGFQTLEHSCSFRDVAYVSTVAAAVQFISVQLAQDNTFALCSKNSTSLPWLFVWHQSCSLNVYPSRTFCLLVCMLREIICMIQHVQLRFFSYEETEIHVTLKTDGSKSLAGEQPTQVMVQTQLNEMLAQMFSRWIISEKLGW